MVTTRLFTIDDLLAMGSDAPYELIEGELNRVSPTSAESSIVTSRLSRFIDQYVANHKLGWAMSAECGFVFRRDPDTVVAPDISYVRKGRMPAGFNFQSYIPVTPDFVVEVVSPSNTATEINRKLTLYQNAGVPLIWIVYPVQRLVTVHQPGHAPATVREGEVLGGSDVFTGLRIPLAEVFLYPLED